MLLQSAEPGAPFPAEAVDAALLEAGVTGAAEGGSSWRLASGAVEVKPLIEGGQRIATELRVPLTDRTSLIRELVAAAAQVAARCGVSLLDLQLNRAVGEKDLEAVELRYLESARYAGEMMGVPEALSASFAPPPDSPFEVKAGAKVVLALIGLFLLVLWLLDAVA